MTRERWQIVERVYHATAACEPDQRAAFLAETCAGDGELQATVDALLMRLPRAVNFLEVPAWDSVVALLKEPSSTRVEGDIIGSFEIGTWLGSGGMGDVYRGRDRRLGREVALKFLSTASAGDADARERLRREALAASALNHPHICTLHEIVDDDAGPVLVMELLSGQPLHVVIPTDGMPVAQVMRYGEQLADALAHAHSHGVIHRDLKPSNIVVSAEGHVKVLDFGIARQMPAHVGMLGGEPDGPPSGAGSILGTLRYLSPEVLAGVAADARSDIWAFGVVLYEMTTGRQPFAGTTHRTLTDAIRLEPMAKLSARVPRTLHMILQKCLAKEPAQRYQSAREIVAALEVARPDAYITDEETRDRAPLAGRPRITGWHVAIVVSVAVVIAAVGGRWRRQSPATPVSRMTIMLGPDESFVGDGLSIAISPDGRRVVYVARRGNQQRLYLRPLDRFEAILLAGTEGAGMPFFSPDGRWLGFFAGGKLRKVSVEGGTPVTLCDAPQGRGADWSPDDSIIFAPDGNTGLYRVAASGGTPRAVTTLNPAADEVSHRAPQFLPGGRTLLYTVLTGQQLTPENRVVSLETGQSRRLIDTASWARYVPEDRLIYVANGVAMTAPFDHRRLVITGPATPVIEDIRPSLSVRGNLWQFAVSATGALAFIPGGRQRSLRWVDRRGAGMPLPAALHPYQQLRLSPDGKRLALTIREPAGPDIWIYELTHDRLTRLTLEGNSFSPVWSPDSLNIAFASNRFGPHNLYVRAANGSGGVQRLTTIDKTQLPMSWSPDGRMISFIQNDPMPDIWSFSFERPLKPRPIVQMPGYQTGPRISPDGRWLAYASEESGQFEVYVTRFPDGGDRSSISTGGGMQPIWARSGRELFYRNGDKLMTVPIDTRGGFSVGTPTLVFQGPALAGTAADATYDVSLDGQQFVLIQIADAATNQVDVVLGWSEELARPAGIVLRP